MNAIVHQPTQVEPSGRRSVAGDYLRFWIGRATYQPVDRPGAAWFLPLWGLSLAVAYACSVLVTIVVVSGGATPPDNAVGEMVEQGSVLGLLLTAVVLAPLIEEVAFRLPMSLRPWHVAGGVAVLAIMFVPSLFGVSLGLALAGDERQAVAGLLELGLVVAITLGLGLVLRRLLPERSKHAPAEISPRVRYGVVVVLTLLFAAAHLSNFSEFTWFLPAFIVPQLLVGMVLAYVRLTRSWWMAVGIHALNNAVAVGFGLMPRYATTELAQGLAGLAILCLVALLGLASATALGVNLYRTWRARHPTPPPHQPVAWAPIPSQPPPWPPQPVGPPASATTAVGE
ncbi:MAG: CPBP family intramembrane metalloprotease [Microthrixaceae bacterium]|nr:CPBP family intramembrane metalloprotease [Microthrixaceae bacterium]